jgi:hypothetical protein
MKGDKINSKNSDKIFKETRDVIFPEKKAKNKKKKLFHVSYEICSELEGMYEAFSKKEAKHLFKKEYQGLARDFEDKIKVKEIPE